jgi:hypothetical protein
MSSPSNTSQQLESPYTIALENISAAKWNMYKDTFSPVEDKYMEKVSGLNDPSQYGLAGGLAQSNVMQQFQPVLDQQKQQIVQGGAAPGSGAFSQGMSDLRTKGATAAAQATFSAQQGQQDAYRGGLESVMGIGNGQAAVAQGSMANLAQQSVDAAKQQTNMNWQNQAQLVKGIGNIGGLLAGAGLSSITK